MAEIPDVRDTNHRMTAQGRNEPFDLYANGIIKQQSAKSESSGWSARPFLVRPKAPAATLQASGSAWGDVRRTFRQIRTNAGPESTIDGGTRRQQYSPQAHRMSCPWEA
jgi:hypothetical protein